MTLASDPQPGIGQATLMGGKHATKLEHPQSNTMYCNMSKLLDFIVLYWEAADKLACSPTLYHSNTCTKSTKFSPVTCWSNKVQAAMHSAVRYPGLSVCTCFFLQIFLILFINGIKDRIPADHTRTRTVQYFKQCQLRVFKTWLGFDWWKCKATS